MRISPLQNLYRPGRITCENTSGIYLNKKLQNYDRISFGALNVFENEAEALDYFDEVAEKTNNYLRKNDAANALKTLGYTISANPTNGKIKILGDYSHNFDYFVKNRENFVGKIKSRLTYQDMGIDTGKLDSNISVITGKNAAAMLFDGQLRHKAALVNEALDSYDYKRALSILGYKTTEDKEGNITIHGNYSSALLTVGGVTKKLSDYGIRETRLLSRVTRIEGDANFENGFYPVKYIDIAGNVYKNDPFAGVSRNNQINQELEKHFLLLKPSIRYVVDRVNEALEKGDNLSALNTLGVDCSRDEDGKITVNRDFDFLYPSLRGIRLSFDDMGIDSQNLLKKVKRIKGDLKFVDSSVKDLHNIQVDGIIHPFDQDHETELFNGYVNTKTLSEACGNINPDVIKTFCAYGILNPDYRTDSDYYFKNISGKDKEFLDYIKNNRDTILTFDELKSRFNVGTIYVLHSLNKKLIKPLGVKYNFDDNIKNYLFDISDKENFRNIDHYSRNKQKASTNSEFKESYQAYVKEDNPYLKYKNVSKKAFPLSALEDLGYGSRADLMEPCMLMTNFYPLQKYILNHDTYDITNPTMQTIILTSRKNNPAIISLGNLRKKLGENEEELNQAILEGKVDVMAVNPYRTLTKSDYCVDLFNEKNYKFLETIDNQEFQDFLALSLSAYNKRKEKNEAYLEEFKNMPPLTPYEQARIVRERVKKAQEEIHKQEQLKKLELQKAKEARARDHSLRMAIAWVLCPETLSVRRELVSTHLNEIFKKNAAALKISQELVAGEISQEEAEYRISKLNLNEKDKIDVLSYHKTCWSISGTKEWADAIKSAGPLVKLYKEKGLEAIEDENVRERIIEWEKENK